MSEVRAGPLVTLALAVWQPNPDWLAQAVASALGQRGCRIELLVIDDGSDPPVESHLAEVSDERMRIVRIAHAGPAAARNAAMRSARGDYVRFLDYDDAYPADSTRRLLARAESRQDVIAYGTTVVCDADLKPVWRMAPRQDGDATVDSLLARFNVRLGGGMLWPRRVLELTGPFDEALPASEDWDFIQRALEHAVVRREPSAVHYYRRHASARTRNYEEGRRVARLIVEQYFERHPDQRGSRLERRARAMLDATSARVYATHGEPRLALRHAARAIRADPLAFGNELGQARSAALGRLATALKRRRLSG